MQAPGVYLEENSSVSLSVRSGATAVPVFVGNFKQKAGLASGANTSGKCIALAHWLDFTAQFEGPTTANVALNEVTENWKTERKAALTEKDEAAKDNLVKQQLAQDGATTFKQKPAFILSRKVYAIDEEAEPIIDINYGAFALQHYFSNGGTRCYLLPLSEHGSLDTLPEEIQKYPDISLLVCAEPEADLKQKLGIQKADIYTKLDTLLGKNLGYFLLADGADPNTEKAQTAVYCPNLVTTFQPLLPTVEDISFSQSGTPLKKLMLVNMIEPSLDALRQTVMVRVEQAFKSFKATQSQIILPPSAAVAGAYARTERARGVWKAPANLPLSFVERVETVISEAEQGVMNQQGINVIRSFAGQGTLIWGACTLAATSNEWRYISVRRLFNAAQRDIEQAMRFAVFESNRALTWNSVKTALENYLYNLWRQGALVGATEKEAYFVQIGLGLTMTETDIEQGKMIVKVGMAAVRPAEFIVLQFTQEMA